MGACPGRLSHNVPFVLRKMDVGYQLIGECFVLSLYWMVKQWKIQLRLFVGRNHLERGVCKVEPCNQPLKALYFPS